MLIRSCKEEDLTGLLRPYQKLRPQDPVMTATVAMAAAG